jgi:exonuclease V gamma subunit
MTAADVWSDELRSTWELVQRRSGRVPPLALGDTVVQTCTERVAMLLGELDRRLGATARLEPDGVPLRIDLGAGRTIDGLVAGVRDHTLVEVTASRLRPTQALVAWARLAALAVARPHEEWDAVVIGRHPTKDTAAVHRMRLASPRAARSALDVIVDLHDRARCDVVPFFPLTAWSLLHEGRVKAENQWLSQRADSEAAGEGADRWVRFAVGELDFDDLIAEETPERELGVGWAGHRCRLEQWAHRIWGTMAATAELTDGTPCVTAESEHG